jgi:hypothetical protein
MAEPVTEPEEVIEEIATKQEKWEREGRNVEGLINDIEWLEGMYYNVKEDPAKATVPWCSHVWAHLKRKGVEDEEAEKVCRWRVWAMLNYVDELEYVSEYTATHGVWKILKGWFLDYIWLDGDFTDMIPRHIRNEAWEEVRRETDWQISYPPETFGVLLRQLASYWVRNRRRYEQAAPAERYEIARTLAPRLIRDMRRRLCNPPRLGYGPFRPRSLVFNVMAVENAARETGETDLEDFLANLRRRLDVESRRVKEWC